MEGGKAMGEMIPFQYGGFWDVPRYILVQYGEKLLYLQSPFNDDLDEYPDFYSVYAVPDGIREAVLSGDWTLLDRSPLPLVGQIPISAVTFDSTKRERLDPSCLKTILG
jgi:hypothetical protein